MSKEWEPNPWSLAIIAAEEERSLAPLLKVLRSSEPLTEAGRAALADALERWAVKPWSQPNIDGLTIACAEEFRKYKPSDFAAIVREKREKSKSYELTARGDVKSIIEKGTGEVAAEREAALEWHVADWQRYGCPVRLDEVRRYLAKKGPTWTRELRAKTNKPRRTKGSKPRP